jgi:hypothetical protein
MGTQPCSSDSKGAAPSMSRATWRTYVCCHVKGGAPALTVHSDEDGDLATSCGRPVEDHPTGSWSVMAWGCLLEQDPSLASVDEHMDHDEPDTWYSRTAVGAPWLVEPQETSAAEAVAGV